MKIYTVMEKWFSTSMNKISVTIRAAFKSEVDANEFIDRNGYPRIPAAPASEYYEIVEKEVKDGEKMVSFLLRRNNLGKMNFSKVYMNKNEALVRKTVDEAKILEKK